jgi:hypothetical protein
VRPAPADMGERLRVAEDEIRSLCGEVLERYEETTLIYRLLDRLGEAPGETAIAATVLKDFDGAYLAAMNQVFSQLAPSNAPLTEETSALIVVAFAELSDQDSDYALASAYVDAFVDYVAALDELGSPVGDSVAYAMAKHGKTVTDNPNSNMSAYVAMRLEGIVN